MTKRVTYLDNAATTPVRPEVLEAMLPYLGKEAFGNPSSAHRFGRAAPAGIEEAKRTIAETLGAEPNQVIFTSGGTEADNLAIIGAALASRDRGGPSRDASAAPMIAKLSASVPPEVKITWLGSAPRVSAIVRLASSIPAGAARPNRWAEDGLPNASLPRYGSIASRTS